MTEPIVKYAQAPHLVYNYPSCGNCHVEVESDDGDFICRPCGTMWSSGAGDDDPGQLYELWSGEVLDVPVTDPDDGWRTAGDFERKRLEAERKEQNARAVVVRAERAAAEVAARATLWAIPVQDLPRSSCCDEQQRVTAANKLLCSACGTEDKSTATSIVRDVERAHRRAERESARVTADPKHVETIEARLARG